MGIGGRGWVALVCLAMMGACAPMPSPAVQSPNSAETVEVAGAAYSIGDYDEAARIYERAAQRDTGSSSAYLGLGRSYAQLGQYSRAQNALVRARELSGRDPAISNELGKLALLQSQPAQAIAQFETALRIDSRNLDAFTGMGVALDYLSRHGEAQAVYARGLAIYPTNFVLMSNNALSMVLSGQGPQGIAIMQELLRDNREGDTVRSNLALAYVLAGREGDAQAVLTGSIPDAELSQTLARYNAIRSEFRTGRPVGPLVFG